MNVEVNINAPVHLLDKRKSDPGGVVLRSFLQFGFTCPREQTELLNRFNFQDPLTFQIEVKCERK